MASRHLSRIATLQTLFAADVRSDFSLDVLRATWKENTDSLAHEDEDRAFTEVLLKGIAAKREEIDGVIEKAAPQWPVGKIAVIDRNILRLGLFELLYGSTISVPPKVALNEAIELAKTFGGEASPKFVNGVLGAVYREMGSPRKEESPRGEEKAQEHVAGVVVCAKEQGEWYVALTLDPFGKWTPPKSLLKEDELSRDAAQRAAREELGLEAVTLLKPIGEHRYAVRTSAQDRGERVALYFVGCSAKKPLTPVEKEGVKDAQWFPAHDLPENDLYEDLRRMIESGVLIAEKGCSHG